MSRRARIVLTDRELALLLEALDSHEYWQLSDPAYRSSGYVLDDGADDPRTRREIRRTRRLAEKLERAGRASAQPAAGVSRA